MNVQTFLYIYKFIIEVLFAQHNYVFNHLCLSKPTNNKPTNKPKANSSSQSHDGLLPGLRVCPLSSIYLLVN